MRSLVCIHVLQILNEDARKNVHTWLDGIKHEEIKHRHVGNQINVELYYAGRILYNTGGLAVYRHSILINGGNKLDYNFSAVDAGKVSDTCQHKGKS